MLAQVKVALLTRMRFSSSCRLQVATWGNATSESKGQLSPVPALPLPLRPVPLLFLRHHLVRPSCSLAQLKLLRRRSRAQRRRRQPYKQQQTLVCRSKDLHCLCRQHSQRALRICGGHPVNRGAGSPRQRNHHWHIHQGCQQQKQEYAAANGVGQDEKLNLPEI